MLLFVADFLACWFDISVYLVCLIVGGSRIVGIFCVFKANGNLPKKPCMHLWVGFFWTRIPQAGTMGCLSHLNWPEIQQAQAGIKCSLSYWVDPESRIKCSLSFWVDPNFHICIMWLPWLHYQRSCTIFLICIWFWLLLKTLCSEEDL